MCDFCLFKCQETPARPIRPYANVRRKTHSRGQEEGCWEEPQNAIFPSEHLQAELREGLGLLKGPSCPHSLPKWGLDIFIEIPQHFGRSACPSTATSTSCVTFSKSLKLSEPHSKSMCNSVCFIGLLSWEEKN